MICTNCNQEAVAYKHGDIPTWHCEKCDKWYATMCGEVKEMPKSGSFEDWPEMKLSFQKTINELLGE